MVGRNNLQKIVYVIALASAVTSNMLVGVNETGTVIVEGVVRHADDVFVLGGKDVTVTGSISLGATGNTNGQGILAVQGERFIHSYGTNNIFLGIQAGNTSLSGSNNSGIGPNALENSTTGEDTICAGYHVLRANTEGSRNSALGSQVLDVLTTGTDNTVLGGYAGRSLTTGSRNIYLGAGVNANREDESNYIRIGTEGHRIYISGVYSHTTGQFGGNVRADENGSIQRAKFPEDFDSANNITFGDGALTSLTTGANNIAIGFNALTTNQSSGSNIAVGHTALQNSTTGTNNVAVGFTALRQGNTGSNNVAVGSGSLLNNTSGDTNIVSGVDAGREHTTGSHNTGVGYAAIRRTDTYSDNVALGYDALRVDDSQALSNINRNTAIGYAVLPNARDTCPNCIGVGCRSLNTLTHHFGGSNPVTACGYQALYKNAIFGDRNVGCGYQALVNNQGSDFNTALGARALECASSNIATHNNSVLGFSAFRDAVGGTRTLHSAAGFGSLLTGLVSSEAGSQPSNDGLCAFGYETLRACLRTGMQNVAIGYEALRNTTSGANNTALGTQALRSNTTSSSNVAVGNQTLRIQTGSSPSNVAVGYEALQANASASNNTAIGYAALKSKGPGDNNVSIGYQAHAAATSGTTNVTVGSGACGLDTPGNDNTAVGYFALRAATAGAIENVALGSEALSLVTTGSNHIAVGSGSGSAITNQTGTIAIGHSGAAESRTIHIGTDQKECHLAGIASNNQATDNVGVYTVAIDIASGRLGWTAQTNGDGLASSRRFKKDITYLKNNRALKRSILELDPVSFAYTQDTSSANHYGLIAEELIHDFPELVTFDKEGTIHGIRYDDFHALLIHEFQQLFSRYQVREMQLQQEHKQHRDRIESLLALLAMLDEIDIKKI